MRIIFIIILFLAILNKVEGQCGFIYENVHLGVRFASTNDWTAEHNHLSASFILENKNHNMVIEIRHQDTNSDATSFLDDLVLFEGLCKIGTSFETSVDHKKAVATFAGCIKMHHPYRVLLIAVKKSNGYDIILATCPEDCFLNHSGQMEDLLCSFEFFNPEESSLYYSNRGKTG